MANTRLYYPALKKPESTYVEEKISDEQKIFQK